VRKNAAHFIVKSIEISNVFMVCRLLIAAATFETAMQIRHGGE